MLRGSNHSGVGGLLHAMQHAGCEMCCLFNLFAVQMLVWWGCTGGGSPTSVLGSVVRVSRVTLIFGGRVSYLLLWMPRSLTGPSLNWTPTLHSTPHWCWPAQHSRRLLLSPCLKAVRVVDRKSTELGVVNRGSQLSLVWSTEEVN